MSPPSPAVAAVTLLEDHPDYQRAYALSAATHLARLNDPEGHHPPHEKHAVILTAADTLTKAKIEEHWAATTPASELHVIVVPDLQTTMDRLYETAAGYRYGDLASGAPQLLGRGTHTPGLSAPVSSADATAAAVGHSGTGPRAVTEAALWLLADWDGMGVARARVTEQEELDPDLRGLAAILVGALGRAKDDLRGGQLEVLADVVDRAWARTITAGEVVTETREIAGRVTSPDLARAVKYVGAAVAHRLSRHPQTLIERVGATGPNVQHLVQRMQRFGRRAFWPSQAAAIAGGLLDRNHPSLAIKMPTSVFSAGIGSSFPPPGGGHTGTDTKGPPLTWAVRRKS